MTHGAGHLPKRKLIIVCSIIGVTLIAIGGGLVTWRVSHTAATVRIPQQISSKLLFTPYVPKKLPSGYTIRTTSFRQNEGALFFAAANANGETITFSEQATPKGYDLNTFYNATIASATRIHARAGSAIYGKPYKDTGTIVSYVTPDNTWLILSATESISKTAVIELINSLHSQE